MARFQRVAAVGTPHHITQRGNARRFVLQTDPDRVVYLELLAQACQTHRLTVLGYCLMSNHVHLIAVPQQANSLALALRDTHGRYAAYLNAREVSSGHVWQGRYYSCPLDRTHLWAALRYTERNPVRAGMVSEPEQFEWSSAGVHCGSRSAAVPIDCELRRSAWTHAEWRAFLLAHDADAEVEHIRSATHTGRPLGAPGFVADPEHDLKRRLAPARGGRPRKRNDMEGQMALGFEDAAG